MTNLPTSSSPTGRIGTPEAGALRVVHNLTQAEITQLAGVSRETVNKSMSEFARRGWINIDGPGVLIRNPNAWSGVPASHPQPLACGH